MRDFDLIVKKLKDKFKGFTKRKDHSIFKQGMIENSFSFDRKEYPLIAPIPNQLKIEVTNLCNHRCIFCPNKDMKRKKGFIDYELALNVISQAKKLGIEEIGFYTTGESLLHKDIFKMIKYAKNQDVKYTYLDTNGAILDDFLITRILESGLDSLKFSCSAGTPQTYKKIHGSDDFNKVIENIKKLYRERENKKSKLIIALSYIINQDNEKETENIHNLLDEYLDEMIFMPMNNFAGQISLDAKEKEIEEFKKYKKAYTPCQYLWSKIIVTYEGFLTICPGDFENQLLYGDLSKESLKSAWNNVKMRNFRKKAIENDINDLICKNCLYG